MTEPFWKTKTLDEMSKAEWESLCDGCAQCCLIKFQDEDTGEIYRTNVVCRLLNLSTARCTRYPERMVLEPHCVLLTVERIKEFSWLPKTCSYRCLAEGRELPAWHPLITGDPKTVQSAGASVLGRVISARYVKDEDLEDYIVDEPLDPEA